MKFAIRSNCMAHGRTRHNRSFKPVFVDIEKGEMIEYEEEVEVVVEEEEPKRKKVVFINEKVKVEGHDVGIFMEWVDYVKLEMDESRKRIASLIQVASMERVADYQGKWDDLVNHLDQTTSQIDQTRVLLNC
jgi:hypothetical protein